MIIFSDSKSTLKNFFGFLPAIKNYNCTISNNLDIIKSKLFPEKSESLFTHEYINNWNYLFLTKYAEESQFDILNKLVSENIELPDKLVCLAETGKGFHGFRNRVWSAEKGNIHLSVYFKPQNNFPNFHVGLLIVAAVSILQTIDLIPDLKNKSKTKWVNDIIINGGKVSGIITQSFSTGSKITGAVIGLGLNVLSEPKFAKDQFTKSAISLISQSVSEKCNLQFIFENLLKNLYNNIEKLNKENYNLLFDEYCKRSAIIGKKVAIYTDPIKESSEKVIVGKVLSIEKNLELIIENYDSPIKNGRLAFVE